MRIYTNYNGRRYQSTYTTIQFTTKGMHLTKGNGYWVDYYSNAPWDYVASRITWHVDNQTIYIHFIEDDTNVEIYDYTLTSDYFSCNIFYNNQLITFNFTPDDDFDSSDYDYSGYYGYGYYNNASGEKPKLIRSFGDIE